jgi:hypothetical protein
MPRAGRVTRFYWTCVVRRACARGQADTATDPCSGLRSPSQMGAVSRNLICDSFATVGAISEGINCMNATESHGFSFFVESVSLCCLAATHACH